MSQLKLLAVGLDVSLNSTAICLLTEGPVVSWHIIAAEHAIKGTKKRQSFYEDLLEDSDIPVHLYTKLPTRSVGHDEITKNRILNTWAVTGILDSILNEYNCIHTEFIFEGYSYGSKGASTIDLISNGSSLRSNCYQRSANIQAIPPATLKKAFANHGFAKKPDMVAKMINILESNEIEVSIGSYDMFVLNEEEMRKPLDDIADAFALIYSFSTIFNDDSSAVSNDTD